MDYHAQRYVPKVYGPKIGRSLGGFKTQKIWGRPPLSLAHILWRKALKPLQHSWIAVAEPPHKPTISPKTSNSERHSSTLRYLLISTICRCFFLMLNVKIKPQPKHKWSKLVCKVKTKSKAKQGISKSWT